MIVLVDLRTAVPELCVVETHSPGVSVQVLGDGHLVDVDRTLSAAGAGRATGHHAELAVAWLEDRCRRAGTGSSDGPSGAAGRWWRRDRLDGSGCWLAAPIHWPDAGDGWWVRVARGVVEHGDARGRTLGFPTANIVLDDPGIADGVWAGWMYRASGERLLAAVSVGVRPTFREAGAVRLMEVHLPGFSGDLYGESVTVVCRRLLRPQRRFAGAGALVRQMERDVAAVVRWGAEDDEQAGAA